jgi:hypothetical protein
MKFGLQKTDMQIACHTFQCFNRAAYYIGRPDSPRGTEYYVCDQCADELKDQVLADYVAKKDEPPEVELMPFEEPVEEKPKKAKKTKAAE